MPEQCYYYTVERLMMDLMVCIATKSFVTIFKRGLKKPTSNREVKTENISKISNIYCRWMTI